MAKFRQGDLVLTATQRIIQGSDTLVDANGAAYFATLEVSGAAQLYTLTFASGATINELSTDGTLAGDSDTAVPTEKAIKTYIDNQIALVNLPHNELQGLQGGDATSSEFYHLTQAIYDALYSSSPLIGLGSQSGTNFEVDYGSDLITASINSTKVLDLQENVQIFGSDNYYIMIDQTSNTFTSVENGTSVFDLSETQQNLGISGDTSISLDQNTKVITIEGNTKTLAVLASDAVELYHDGVKVAETTQYGITGAVWG